MTVRIIVSSAKTTPETIERYRFEGSVEHIGEVIVDGNHVGVIWEAPNLYAANNQLDRLSSGFIGARIVQTPEEEAEFVNDLIYIATL